MKKKKREEKEEKNPVYHISQISRHVALIQISLSACSIPDLGVPSLLPFSLPLAENLLPAQRSAGERLRL